MVSILNRKLASTLPPPNYWWIQEGFDNKITLHCLNWHIKNTISSRLRLNVKDIFSEYVAPGVLNRHTTFWPMLEKDTTNLLEGLEIGGLVERDCRD